MPPTSQLVCVGVDQMHSVLEQLGGNCSEAPTHSERLSSISLAASVKGGRQKSIEWQHWISKYHRLCEITAVVDTDGPAWTRG